MTVVCAQYQQYDRVLIGVAVLSSFKHYRTRLFCYPHCIAGVLKNPWCQIRVRGQKLLCPNIKEWRQSKSRGWQERWIYKYARVSKFLFLLLIKKCVRQSAVAILDLMTFPFTQVQISNETCSMHANTRHLTTDWKLKKTAYCCVNKNLSDCIKKG